MNKPFIVAELSGNHLGDHKRALSLVETAALVGADAVKIQVFTPEQMADADTIVAEGPWAGKNLLDLYRETHTPREWVPTIFDFAKELGILAFASVFHPDDVDFLETMNCPIYKISSFELTDLALIKYVAKTGKPIIISTGMGAECEIMDALVAAKGCESTTLLKCTSAYPAVIEDANLATLSALMQVDDGFDYVYGGRSFPRPFVGLSDHTIGYVCAAAATALGATVIEKHLTLSRGDGGADAAFSAEPDEFKMMINICRDTAKAIGKVHYGPGTSEAAHVGLKRQSGGKRGSLYVGK